MTDLETLPFIHDDGRLPNGARGRPKCRHPKAARLNVAPIDFTVSISGPGPHATCSLCGHNFYPLASRRGRSNRSRGNRAELAVAREIPGARKMGPLGLPWDVEVGEYARLQVKKLARRPGPAEVARLIAAIPDTGDRLRGFVWVEAAGQGKRGQRVVWFLWGEFTQWHGIGEASGWDTRANLVTMPLAEWVAEFVGDDRAAKP